MMKKRIIILFLIIFLAAPCNTYAYRMIDGYGPSATENGDSESNKSDKNTNAVLDELEVKDVNICQPDSSSLKVFQVIGYLLIIAKIIVPIILIILGSITFAKAALSNDEKSTKDAAGMLGKKIIIGLTIFFIPGILDFGLSLVSGVSGTMQKFENCTNCIFNPDDLSKCNPPSLQSDTVDNANNIVVNYEPNESDEADNKFDCYYEYTKTRDKKKYETAVGYNINGKINIITYNGDAINKSIDDSDNELTSTFTTDKCYKYLSIYVDKRNQGSRYVFAYKLGNTANVVQMHGTYNGMTIELQN